MAQGQDQGQTERLPIDTVARENRLGKTSAMESAARLAAPRSALQLPVKLNAIQSLAAGASVTAREPTLAATFPH